jgi:very-short-patch-repair endonuclease
MKQHSRGRILHHEEIVQTVDPNREVRVSAPIRARLVPVLLILMPMTAPVPGSPATPSVEPSLGPEERQKLASAFELWRRRLLDLSKRNRAINYKPQRVATVTIDGEHPSEVFRQLVEEGVSFTFASNRMQAEDLENEPDLDAPGLTPYSQADLTPRHRDTVLQCRATPDALDLSLRRLADVQRSSLEEQGVNTLYLTLGMLHYTEAPQSEVVLRAPLVLVPVLLTRKNAQSGFKLSVGDDEPMLNPSLVEYLRRIHEVKLPALPEIGEEGAAGLDLQRYLGDIQALITGFASWKVTEEMALTPLAFAKLVMYRDLEQHEDAFVKHGLLQKLVLRHNAPELGLPDAVAHMDLDQDFPPERTQTVVDADSSQMRAIAAVDRGYDLVVHGPPGTGKSQTITNLIAQALGSGKSVLFVSEKTAALEVVARRLKDVGLSPFCLELHSVKANKAEALVSLRTALDETSASSTATPTVSTLLPKVRQRLNSYTKALHQKRTLCDASFFEMTGRLARTFSAPKIPFVGDSCDVIEEQLGDLLARCRQADAVGAEVADVRSHGWRESRRTTLSDDEIDEIAGLARAIVENVEALCPLADAIGETFGCPIPLQARDVATATALAEIVARSPGWSDGLLRSNMDRGVADELRMLVQEASLIAELGRRSGARYHLDRVGTPDQKDIEYVLSVGAGFLGGIKTLLDGRCRSLKKVWLGLVRSGGKFGVLEMANDMDAMRTWVIESARLRRNDRGTEWFGSAWRGADSDIAELTRRVDWLAEFLLRLPDFANAEVAIAASTAGPNQMTEIARLRQLAATLDAAAGRLTSSLAWPEGYLQMPFRELSFRVHELLSQVRRGPTWAAFVNATLGLGKSAAEPVGNAAFEGAIPPTAIASAFERSHAADWLKRVAPGVPELCDFSAKSHEATRLDFQDLDSKVYVEHRSRIRETIRGGAKSRFESALAKHRQFLVREMSKQKRHRPLRVTMTEAYEAVRSLKPCFMMSPMSVAQFLPPNAKFDLVIFDEASQLPTEDAIGAVARGAQLVIVGDPKQLPPTNFFSVQTGVVSADQDEEGNYILEETESVLEECLSAGLHQQHLQWHYRSAHERLIQFSNEMFYGDNLLVFPAAQYDGPDLGVQFEYVADGIYEGAGLNQVEARRVAAAVVEHFKTASGLSLGVGTFNMRQQNAILDEIERFRREDSSLEEYFSRERHEPFFVKNLENIQGDERDVILLSVTYGRNKEGILRYNFGPLNRDNGGRRLNVLASRARQRMRIFSSIRASDIDPNATATKGPSLLRDFLLFAETGRIQHHRTSQGETESPFEAHVLEELQNAGYIVDAQVGVGKYRIDLGVRHAARPGIYLAGIECDGASYHSAPCARDRDRLRQTVLEVRGWTIMRIWSTDWFKDRSGTLDRVLRSLESLREGASEELDAPAA